MKFCFIKNLERQCVFFLQIRRTLHYAKAEATENAMAYAMMYPNGEKGGRGKKLLQNYSLNDNILIRMLKKHIMSYEEDK